jgi:hypothetical protein
MSFYEGWVKAVVILNLIHDLTSIGAKLNYHNDLVSTSLQKILHCEADFSSAEAISIEESAKEIASSCLLAMTNSYSY